MNTFDIIVFVALAFAAYKGYQQGLLIEVVKILAFIISLIAGFKLMDKAMVFLAPNIHQEKFLPLIAFIFVFTITFVIIMFLGKILKKTLDITLLGAADNALGALLGAFRIFFGIGMVCWLIHTIHIDSFIQFLNLSFFYPIFLKTTPAIVDFFAAVMPFDDIFQTIKTLLKTSKS